MVSLRDVYNRFIENYRTENGGINLYPQFDDDLEFLLDYINGLLNPYKGTDCVLRPPLGEDD